MDASIDFSGVLKGSIADGGGGGDSVIITPVVTSGTKIADVSVNGVEKDLYCPTPPSPPQINITPVVTSGTKIADVSVGGVEKNLYTPDYGADITALDDRLDIAETDITEIKQSLSNLITLEKTASGRIVTFDDGSGLPILSLKVSIEAVQSGSGDPSPTNIRPISGWDKTNVVVSPTTDAEDGQTYTIQFKDGDNPLTVYGGTLDVVSGELTVDRAYVDMGEKTINKYADGQFYFVEYTDFIDFDNTNPSAICEIYQNISYSKWINKGVSNGICGINSSHVVYILDDRFTSETDLHNALNGYKLIVKLTTPQTIQLTPTQVNSLLGVNNIWADTGDLEIIYFVNNSLVQSIYDMINVSK